MLDSFTKFYGSCDKGHIFYGFEDLGNSILFSFGEPLSCLKNGNISSLPNLHN